MDTNETIRIVLFFTLLLVVVIEIVITGQMSMIPYNVEQLLQFSSILAKLGVLDKLLTIALLGVLAFMKFKED